TTVRDDNDITHVLAVVDQNQLQHLLARVVEPDEFLSPFGMRSLSKFHEEHPFTLGDASVGYEPAEAAVILKGGNSNWRGPVWFPTTFLMIETLRKLEKAFGHEVRVEVDEEVAREEMGNAYSRATEGIGAGATHVHTRGITLAPAAAPAARTMGLTGLARMLADRLINIFLP